MNFIVLSKFGPWPFYAILLFFQTLLLQSVNGGGNEVDEVFSSIENLTKEMAQLVPHSHKIVKNENEEEAMLKFMGTNLTKSRQFLVPLGKFLTAASKYYQIDDLANECKKIVEKLEVIDHTSVNEHLSFLNPVDILIVALKNDKIFLS
jgi:hypothetical protein